MKYFKVKETNFIKLVFISSIFIEAFISIFFIKKTNIFIQLRDLQYLLLPILLYFIFILIFINKKVYIHLHSYLLPWILLIIYSLITIQYNLQLRGLKEITFIAIAFFPFLFIKEKINDKILIITNYFIILIVLFNLLMYGSHFSILILESKSDLESIISFILGFFFTYWLIKKNFSLSIINYLALIITLKRIALLASIIILFLYFLPNFVKNIILSKIFLLFLMFFIVFLLFVFINGYFDTYILDYFHVSSNFLTMGRRNIWENTINNIHFDIMHILFGYGFGYITNLSIIQNSDLLHSDLLKLLLENGIIFFGVFFFLLFNSVKFAKNRFLLLFFCIGLITDNYITYTIVLFFFFLLLHNIYIDEKKEVNIYET